MQQRPMRRSSERGGEGRKGEREEGRRGERDAPPPGPSESLPVFLFPTELVFHSGQRSSHRRVLTLYNPYNFPLRFKMLCTAPSLYTVVDAEGSVRARSCVDIVVRHQDVSARHWGRRDRFRLDVWGGSQGGSREIWAELRGDDGGERCQESPQDRPAHPGAPPSIIPQALYSPARGGNTSQFAMYVVLGLVCVAVLMLPLQSEPSPMVPSHAHVTVMQKLVCAYVLGLLTMVFLR